MLSWHQSRRPEQLCEDRKEISVHGAFGEEGGSLMIKSSVWQQDTKVAKFRCLITESEYSKEHVMGREKGPQPQPAPTSALSAGDWGDRAAENYSRKTPRKTPEYWEMRQKITAERHPGKRPNIGKCGNVFRITSMLKNKSSKKTGNVSNCLRAHHIQTCQATGMAVSRTGHRAFSLE